LPDRAIVVDCETTGLILPSVADISKQPQIIELACSIIESGAVISEHSWLINPGVPLSADIIRITKLTDADLAGKPSFADLLPEIAETFHGSNVFIAHNAPFDKGCIEFELRRLNHEHFPWPEETLCTVQSFEYMFGRRAKLTQLYKRVIGQELKQTHRAMDDVRALVEIVLKERLA